MLFWKSKKWANVLNWGEIKVINGYWTLCGKKWDELNSYQKSIFNQYFIVKKNGRISR